MKAETYTYFSYHERLCLLLHKFLPAQIPVSFVHYLNILQYLYDNLRFNHFIDFLNKRRLIFYIFLNIIGI